MLRICMAGILILMDAKEGVVRLFSSILEGWERAVGAAHRSGLQ